MSDLIWAEKEINFSRMQGIAHNTLWHPDTTALACVTGYGGGKSFFNACQLNIVAANFPGVYMLAGSPTYPMLKRTLWRSMCEVTPKGNIVRQNNQELSMVLDYHNGNMPFSEVFFLPASIPAQNWQGANLGFALLDESDGIPNAHYTQVFARMRQTVDYQDGNGPQSMPNKLLIATNPPPGDHWLPRDFYVPKTKRKNFELLQWSSLDNPFNPESYGKLLLDTYHGEERERAVYGKLGTTFAGMIFDNFEPDYHTLPQSTIDKIREEATVRIYGMDHGFTNPFAFLELCFWPRCNAWVITAEFYHDRLSIKEKAQGIMDIYPYEDTTIYPIYSDHAAQDRAELERDYEIITIAALKNKARDKRKHSSTLDDSIMFTRERMYRDDDSKQARLFVGENCHHTIMEFKSFRNDKSKLTEEFAEGKYKGPNHAIDACRYALYTHETRVPSLFIGGGARDAQIFDNNKREILQKDDNLRYEQGIVTPEYLGANDDADFGI